MVLYKVRLKPNAAPAVPQTRSATSMPQETRATAYAILNELFFPHYFEIRASHCQEIHKGRPKQGNKYSDTSRSFFFSMCRLTNPSGHHILAHQGLANHGRGPCVGEKCNSVACLDSVGPWQLESSTNSSIGQSQACSKSQMEVAVPASIVQFMNWHPIWTSQFL